ncbi:MAG: F0F1 ATP synthase subunit B [Desulfarculales bacterium]|jgi:F-type H+-transporting ATPase subunit b|nr:F0F1 ATP synthase subunit B [Desulfarculales bacterium]
MRAVLSLALVTLLACPALASEEGASMLESFLVRTLNFAVFFAILFFFLRKPIKKALAGRRENIRQELEALQAEKENAARLKAEAEELLGKAETESQRLLMEYRQQAEIERSRILKEAAQQIERMHEQAQLTIEREMNLAYAKLKKELALAAMGKAEEILRVQVTAQDQERLNKEFIANLPRTLG